MTDRIKESEEMSAEDTYRYWHAAFQHKVGQKTISQVDLVKKLVDIDPKAACGKGHLNAVYKERLRKDSKTGEIKTVRAATDLQHAIAQAFGYSHLEFVNLGKAIIEGVPISERSPVVDNGAPEKAIDIHMFPVWSEEELKSMSTDQLLHEVTEYSNYITEAFTSYAQMISTLAFMLAKERNRLVDEKAKSRRILESLSDLVIVVDKRGFIKYNNKAFRSMFGDCQNEPHKDYLCPHHEEEERCVARMVFEDGNPRREIEELDNTWWAIDANPVWGSAGEVLEVVIVYRDITKEHKKALDGKVKKNE